MYAIILGFITSFTLTFTIIPVVIRVAKERRLYDKPNERSAHKEPTPSLGGVAIFAGAICSIVLWTPMQSFGVLQYILAAFVLIFLLGVLDDLLPMSPTKKFAGQLLVAVIVSYKANIRISSFYGVFGVTEIPEITSFMLSVVVIVGIINAFNLIDGINGLAGSVGLLACIFWGAWFLAVGAHAFAIVAFSLAGSIIAFLKYNFTPAKIFMGDTGSLMIGTACSILAIQFIEMNHVLHQSTNVVFGAAPAIAIGILILPLFDTLRVFSIRIFKGKSPFHPDRNHIHHLLLDSGFTHMQATATLVGVNLVFIGLVIGLNRYGTLLVLLCELSLALFLTFFLTRFAHARKMAKI
ncbi:MAG: undecaprenyl/decaprenyl-phosphate alpha-N-acetylglucosaminyl 1-phosphate transferase [Bacteroidetes bacterium]|nr:undecaprenyl/decaprenyl-phosphate alpha-N-acetylglucosaminyl 1-phosphate transferase [Bacteroidota bacterium]